LCRGLIAEEPVGSINTTLLLVGLFPHSGWWLRKSDKGYIACGFLERDESGSSGGQPFGVAKDRPHLNARRRKSYRGNLPLTPTALVWRFVRD
jgi:hypothetical protein